MRKFLGALLAVFVLGAFGVPAVTARANETAPATLRDDDKDKDKDGKGRHHRRHHRRHHHCRHHKHQDGNGQAPGNGNAQAPKQS